MKNFFEKPKLKAQSHRNPFDLSYGYQNTLPFGAILPCGFWQVNPNDKIRLTNEYQIICDALVRPAFTRLKAHVNYYFIPATQIWMQFDNFITGQGSYFSSAVRDVQINNSAGEVPNTVPTFTGSFLQGMFAALGLKVDELGYNMKYGACRLLDALGYHNFYGWLNNGTIDDPADTTDFTLLPDMNFFALACYQKVYYDYFRNPLYEDNKVNAYNLDRLPSNAIVSTYSSAYEDLFKLHYRWLKRDYFMQTQPSSLVTSSQLGYNGLSTSMTNMSGVFGIPGMSTDNPILLTPAAANVDAVNAGNSVITGGYNSPTTPSKPRITVANIRTAFAFDRLLRRMREAGADFDRQMLAQFGVAPYDSRHGKCYHIGGFVNQLQTNSITNQTAFVNSAQGDSLGELAGQINYYANNTDKQLEYHVKEMGFVIGVVSISNENSYQSYRTNRYNLLKDRFDFFNEVFEDLGLQPLFQGELDNTDPTSSSESMRGRSISMNVKKIIGYIRRYSELKTRPDEIHGNLCKWSDIADLTAWNMQYYRNNWQVQTFGAGTPLNISDMLLDPGMMNDIVGVNFNGDPQTDQFIFNIYNHCHIVSNMTRLGENF